MLTIRSNQQKRLDTLAHEQFLAAMERHLRQCFAEWVQPYGSEDLRAFNGRVWQRADTYALTTELGVFSYLNATMIFGETFETQPGFAWARAILEDADLTEEMRIERLQESTEAWLEQKQREENP